MDTKEKFDATIERCKNLCKLNQSEENDDLLRAAIVLGVAALDAYAIDRFMDGFVQYIKHHIVNEQTVRFLADSGFTLKDALELIHDRKARPFRRIRTVVENASSKKSMHSFERIDDLYKFYELQSITTEAATLGRNKRKASQMLSDIEYMISRRHDIAHAADYNGKNKLNEVLKAQIDVWLNTLEQFVNSMEEILQRKYQKGP